MGGGASVSIPGNALSPAVFAILHFDLQQGALSIDRSDTTLNLSDQELFERIQLTVDGATKEVELVLADCRFPAVVLFKFTQLNEQEREDFAVAVLEAATNKDQSASTKAKAVDYSKSFGGTEEDHKKEAEAAAFLRGDQVAADNGILTQPNMLHPSEHTVLKAAGKWMKFLSNSGCYLYIHSLTRDMVAVRPDDFIEDAQEGMEEAKGVEEERDVSNGLPKVKLVDLPAMVEHIVNELHMTPLIIDNSESEVVRTYYSYKANVADLSSLTIPYGKSGVKKEDIMERCRHVLVNSMKKGQLFVLYMGATSIEHADLKTKLCKKVSQSHSLLGRAHHVCACFPGLLSEGRVRQRR